jgi:hypothetical protein
MNFTHAFFRQGEGVSSEFKRDIQGGCGKCNIIMKIAACQKEKVTWMTKFFLGIDFTVIYIYSYN